MRAEHFGGVHGDTVVRVQREGKMISIKISELEPDDYLSVPGKWNWQLLEVRCFKRKVAAYRVSLASGESLVVAEGTVLAGLAGPLAPHANQAKPALFFARQNARKRESRRLFVVSLLGSQKAAPWLKKLFSAPLRLGSTKKEKQFHYPAQALRFLHRTLTQARHRGEPLSVFSGVFADRRIEQPEDKPNLQLNLPGDAYAPAILPLFAVKSDTQPKIIASAKSGYDGRLELRVVQSIQKISHTGPWYFPIFHQQPVQGKDVDNRYLSRGHRNVHPWSFGANGVAVFCPDEHVDNRLFLATGRSKEVLWRRSRNRPYVPSLDTLYTSAKPQKKESPLAAATGAKQVARIFARLRKARVPERTFCRELAKALQTAPRA